MFDSENVFTHILQFAFVTFPSTGVSQTFYSFFDNHSIKSSRMSHLVQLSM